LSFVNQGLSQSVSISDFIPRLLGLPSQCEAAYTAAIPGCTINDFLPPNICSTSCLNGLVRVNGQVTTACQDVKVNSSSLLGLFLLGKGIQALCNVAVVTTTTGLSGTTTVMTIPMTSTTAPPITLPLPAIPNTFSTLSTQTSNTILQTTSKSHRTTTATVNTKPSSKSSASAGQTQPAAASQNPSKPTCTAVNKDSGSPFDSFTDQLCSKKSLGSSIRTKDSATTSLTALWTGICLMVIGLI